MAALGAKELSGKLTEGGDVEIDLGTAPKELQELVRLAQQGKKGAPLSDGQVVVPTPGFVIKTSDAGGLKFFINVCMSPLVAAPGSWTEGQVPDKVKEALEAFAREGEGDPESLRFPLSLGEGRLDEDHQGRPCTVVDCILNQDVVKQAQSYRPLKRFLIEMVMRWVEEKMGVALDHQFKLPKMRYKGHVVQSQTIRSDRKQLVQEVRGPDEAPVFALPINGRTAAAAKAATASASAGLPGSGPPAPSAPSAPWGPKPVAAAKAVKKRRDTAQAQAKTANAAFSFDSKPAKPVQRTSGDALEHELEFEGAPAEAALLQIRLPKGGARVAAADVQIEVKGTSAVVRIPGYPALEVETPFHVTAKGGRAVLRNDARLLTVRLPWKPYIHILDELKAQNAR